ILATLVVVAGTADARLHRAWSYPELMKAADLVVIATPGGTTATSKLEELPGIVETDASGQTSKVKAERLETELEIAVTLKGKAATKIVLHHTRENPVGRPQINGPGFVSFDPKDKRQYLMFLV